jgi:hypothetical protein
MEIILKGTLADDNNEVKIIWRFSKASWQAAVIAISADIAFHIGSNYPYIYSGGCAFEGQFLSKAAQELKALASSTSGWVSLADDDGQSHFFFRAFSLPESAKFGPFDGIAFSGVIISHIFSAEPEQLVAAIDDPTAAAINELLDKNWGTGFAFQGILIDRQAILDFAVQLQEALREIYKSSKFQ